MEYAKDEVFRVKYKEDEIEHKNSTSFKTILFFLIILGFGFSVINLVLIYNFINLLAIL